MVDRPRALRLLDGMRAALGDLDRHATLVTAERLATDPDARNMVLHAVYRAVQAAVDLAHHVFFADGMELLKTYEPTFAPLAKAGWIDADLASRLAGWAGLGRIIARGYLDLDLGRVHEALADRDDLHRFGAAIAARLGGGP